MVQLLKRGQSSEWYLPVDGTVEGVVGTPGRHNPNGREKIDPTVEEYVDPHQHADDAARAAADELAESKDPKVRAIDKHVRMTQWDCRV